jgi:cytochrome oxidase Cu insertion factor (SCO1/SenC/PrrC family)
MIVFTLTLQKSEGFRVKAFEGEVVVLYFEPATTQDLKSSGFPLGKQHGKKRLHPSNSPMEVSKK